MSRLDGCPSLQHHPWNLSGAPTELDLDLQGATFGLLRPRGGLVLHPRRGVVPGSELACNILRGVFYASRDQAEALCAASYSLFELSADLGDHVFLTREKADQACNPAFAVPLTTPMSVIAAEPPIRIDDVSPGPNAKPASGSSQWGRMLALSSSGKELILGQPVSWTTPNGAALVEHVAVRSAMNELLVFY